MRPRIYLALALVLLLDSALYAQDPIDRVAKEVKGEAKKFLRDCNVKRLYKLKRHGRTKTYVLLPKKLEKALLKRLPSQAREGLSWRDFLTNFREKQFVVLKASVERVVVHRHSATVHFSRRAVSHVGMGSNDAERIGADKEEHPSFFTWQRQKGDWQLGLRNYKNHLVFTPAAGEELITVEAAGSPMSVVTEAATAYCRDIDAAHEQGKAGAAKDALTKKHYGPIKGKLITDVAEVVKPTTGGIQLRVGHALLHVRVDQPPAELLKLAPRTVVEFTATVERCDYLNSSPEGCTLEVFMTSSGKQLALKVHPKN
tara:strand:+ start:143 stop:1084 length:942 start_codon:yes stop_codon:yes gene_type:complete